MEGLRILLVDDEEDLVGAMAERLAMRGFEVQSATTAADALKRLSEDRFDVLILDVKMPGSGGLKLMAQIAKEHPGLPVILFTGHASVADAEKGMREGAFDYLVKPIDVDALVGTIRHAANSMKETHS